MTDVSISTTERICLECLSDHYYSEANCLYMRTIAAFTNLTLTQVRRSVRSLARKGYTDLVRGLVDDDGLLKGSGYCATPAGHAFIQATPNIVKQIRALRDAQEPTP